MQDILACATRAKRSKVRSFFPLSRAVCETVRQCDQLTHPDHRIQAYTTTSDRDKKDPTPDKEEQAQSPTNGETNSEEKIIDPDVDYEKYPDYEALNFKWPPNRDDTETNRGDGSDIYRPEGDFGLARPWLRPVYDIDAEEPDWSEEIARWERQVEETGISIYIPPGKTIDDLKWGRPLPPKEPKEEEE